MPLSNPQSSTICDQYINNTNLHLLKNIFFIKITIGNHQISETKWQFSQKVLGKLLCSKFHFPSHTLTQKASVFHLYAICKWVKRAELNQAKSLSSPFKIPLFLF